MALAAAYAAGRPREALPAARIALDVGLRVRRASVGRGMAALWSPTRVFSLAGILAYLEHNQSISTQNARFLGTSWHRPASSASVA